MSFWQRLSPARLLGCKIKHRFCAWRLVKQRPTIGERILLRRGGYLVHEAFDDEHGMRRTDAAPERCLNTGGLHSHIFDVKVREVVYEVDCPFSRIRIEPVV